MKLSEMTTDKAADVLVKIVDPAAEIMNDGNVWEALNGFTEGKRENAMGQLVFIVQKIVPVLLKDHRVAFYEILSALTGKTVKDIANQNMTQTIMDAKGCIEKDLFAFFTQLKEPKESTATE